MNIGKLLRRLRRNRKAQVQGFAAAAIIGSIIATAFAMIVGALLLGETYDVADTLVTTSAGDDVNDTIEGMFDIIWPSMNLLPLQILILAGAAIMAAVGLLMATR